MSCDLEFIVIYKYYKQYAKSSTRDKHSTVEIWRKKERGKSRCGPSWSINKILVLLKTLYIRNLFLDVCPPTTWGFPVCHWEHQSVLGKSADAFWMCCHFPLSVKILSSFSIDDVSIIFPKKGPNLTLSTSTWHIDFLHYVIC